MAGVSNQPNLKPLIDEQTSKIDVDNYWRFKNIEDKVSESKQVVEVAISESNAGIEQKIQSAKTANQAAIAQSTVDSEAITNAARDLIAGQLTLLGEEIETLKSELQLFKDNADFGLYKPIENLNINPVGTLPIISFSAATAEIETVYFRNGKGAITHLITHDGHELQVFVDGVLVIEKPALSNSNPASRSVIPDAMPYIKYSKSIDIRFKKSSGGNLYIRDFKAG